MDTYLHAYNAIKGLTMPMFERIVCELPKIKEEISNREKIISCPHCGNNNIIKNGKVNNTQRYYCKKCHKYFNNRTNTLTSHCSKFEGLLPDLIDGTILRKPLRKISEIYRISLTTAFNYRHKILNLFEDKNIKNRLFGKVEIDETFIDINLKGTKHENMPRPSKLRKTRSQSRSELVCIETGIDEKKTR